MSAKTKKMLMTIFAVFGVIVTIAAAMRAKAQGGDFGSNAQNEFKKVIATK
jgi:hypothetical protein